jgi:hypothetical protein
VLARARADLADALREAGVLLDPPAGAPTAAPPASGPTVGATAASGSAPAGERATDGGPTDEASTGQVPAVGVGAPGTGDDPAVGDRPDRVEPIEWRSVSIPDETEDDPFLAELRRAVTDPEPLGPREQEPTQEHRAFEEPESRFRIRRNRG